MTYLLSINVLALSAAINKIFTIKIDLDLKNGPRSNVNMPIESQYLTMAIVMFSLSVTVCEIFVVENMHDLDLDLLSWLRSNVKLLNQ